MGFGIGLRVVIIAMAHLLNGPMFAVTSMMSALIAVLIESVQLNLQALMELVLFGVAVTDGVAMTVRNKLTKIVLQKQRRGSFLMMNMMRWIFSTKMRLAAHGVRLKFPQMNHTTPAKKSINAMSASATSN